MFSHFYAPAQGSGLPLVAVSLKPLFRTRWFNLPPTPTNINTQTHTNIDTHKHVHTQSLMRCWTTIDLHFAIWKCDQWAILPCNVYISVGYLGHNGGDCPSVNNLCPQWSCSLAWRNGRDITGTCDVPPISLISFRSFNLHLQYKGFHLCPTNQGEIVSQTFLRKLLKTFISSANTFSIHDLYRIIISTKCLITPGFYVKIFIGDMDK